MLHPEHKEYVYVQDILRNIIVIYTGPLFCTWLELLKTGARRSIEHNLYQKEKKKKRKPPAWKWIAFILWLDTLSYFHSSIYLSGRAFMCHFLLSFETSVETMVPLQHFLLFCLCSAKHDGTNEPIKRAGGCAVPGGKPRNWDGLISWKVGLTWDSQQRRLASGKLPWCKTVR